MPTVVPFLPGFYQRLGDWVWYTGCQDIKDEGWKLHVSGRVVLPSYNGEKSCTNFGLAAFTIQEQKHM